MSRAVSDKMLDQLTDDSFELDRLRVQALTGNQWAPRLDAAGFREGVEALGLNLTTCAGPLGLLPRQVRRYANGERTRIPRSLEILIAQLRAIRGV